MPPHEKIFKNPFVAEPYGWRTVNVKKTYFHCHSPTLTRRVDVEVRPEDADDEREFCCVDNVLQKKTKKKRAKQFPSATVSWSPEASVKHTGKERAGRGQRTAEAVRKHNRAVGRGS